MTERAVFVGGPWDGARCWVTSTPVVAHVELKAIRDTDGLFVFAHSGYIRSTEGPGTEEYRAYADKRGKGPNGAPVDERWYLWQPA